MREAGRARRLFVLRCGSLAATLLGAMACGGFFGTRMLLRDHPLVNRIWDAENRRFIDAATLYAELRRASVVLLGESHDNPEHHRIQAEVLAALSAAGEKRALAMEQFDVEHQAALDAVSHVDDPDADDIADAGRLERSGWNWSYYRPLVKVALARGMPIVAANLSRTLARRIVTGGFAALGERAAGMPMESTWSAFRDSTMAELINRGHCGQAPENIVRGIVLAQRARDATMAAAMTPHLGRGVVGIVGRGHARRDVGIPLYLAARSPAATVRVLGLVEVQEDDLDVAAYDDEEGASAYDYVWFTARAARPDPCAGLRPDRLPGTAGQ